MTFEGDKEFLVFDDVQKGWKTALGLVNHLTVHTIAEASERRKKGLEYKW